jgi:hypothetical protein
LVSVVGVNSPPSTLMRTLGGEVVRGRWRWSAVGHSPMEPFAVVALLYLRAVWLPAQLVKPAVLSVRFQEDLRVQASPPLSS